MSARKTGLFIVAVALLGTTACGGLAKNAQQDLRTAVEEKKPTLDTCYESALKRDKTISGEVTLWLHVGKDSGTVSKIEVTNAGINDTELMRCMENAIVGTKMPKAPGANMKVEYKLQFSPKTGAVSLLML